MKHGWRNAIDGGKEESFLARMIAPRFVMDHAEFAAVTDPRDKSRSTITSGLSGYGRFSKAQRFWCIRRSATFSTERFAKAI